MHTHTDQKRQFNIVMVILFLSILLEQCFISKIIPWASKLLGITPILVVLGIPVNLPFTLGLIPIFICFTLFYSIFIFPYNNLQGDSSLLPVKKKIKAVVVGIAAIPGCMLLGGLIYFLIRDYLSKNFRNAVESFGINADIYYPANEITHLKGSMILLIGFFIGVYIFRRKIKMISSNNHNRTESTDVMPETQRSHTLI